MTGAALREQPAPWHPTLEVEMHLESTKTCIRCGFAKLRSEFYAHRLRADGLDNRCKSCSKALAGAWYAVNGERAAVRTAARYAAHHDRILAERAARSATRRAEESAARAARYAANRDLEAALHAAWRKAHPNLSHARVARYAARKRGAAVADLTAPQWEAIKAIWGYRCAYCVIKPSELTQDHIIPLSNGGNHTASNVVPACRPCNSRKRTGPPPVPVQSVLLV